MNRLRAIAGPLLATATLVAATLGVATPAAASTTATLDVATPAAAAPAGLPGMDVSSYQGNVNWSAAWNNGARFAYVKATEGTYYTNPYFAQQYNGSYNVGMIRGSYHFARPDTTSGATQANYFVDHGGGWSKDGKTLPGALDIEYNPYGATCYGLSQARWCTWIRDFVNTVPGPHRPLSDHLHHHRLVDHLHRQQRAASPPPTRSGSPATPARSAPCRPAGPYSFWQWASSGTFPGDQNVWNGTLDRLRVLACNGPC